MKRNGIIQWAVPVTVLLIFISSIHQISAQSDSTTTPDANTSRIPDIRHPHQLIYYIEARASKDGWTADLYQEVGDQWNALGDIHRAVPYWEAAAVDNADPVLLQKLGAVYIQLQRWPQAQQTLERLLESDNSNTWAQYQLGLILAAFDPIRAREYLNSVKDSASYGATVEPLLPVLQVPTGQDPVSMRIGFKFAEMEMWEYAELAFLHTANLTYPNPQALAYLALARDEQGKDGSYAIQQALTLSPDNASIHYFHALHLRAIGSFEESLNAVLIAVQLDPQNPLFYAELGHSYHLVNNLEQAEYWLRIARDLSGNMAEYEKLLDAFYAEEMPFFRIVSTLEQAPTTPQTDDPDIMSNYGWSLHIIGRTEDGLAQIEAALEIEPENPRALYDKARILLDTGQLDEALALFKQVAGTDSPYAQDANRIIEQLEGES